MDAGTETALGRERLLDLAVAQSEACSSYGKGSFVGSGLPNENCCEVVLVLKGHVAARMLRALWMLLHLCTQKTEL